MKNGAFYDCAEAPKTAFRRLLYAPYYIKVITAEFPNRVLFDGLNRDTHYAKFLSP